MKFIKDPVHGYVEVEAELLPLLDSPPVQRLRHVKQLGFSCLVYPGANHTRFEHSLGTMHLATILARHLGLDPADVLLIGAAGLLHDIGHGPFSHTSEAFLSEFAGHDHHQVDHLLGEPALASAIEEADLDPAAISALVRGEHPLADLIHGDLDADRMDYLLRDAHYTGVPYGTVDAERLIQSSILTDGGLGIVESGVQAAESLLIARTLMRSAVYFHHTSRIATSMLSLALCEHAAGGSGDPRGIPPLDDAGLCQVLAASKSDVARSLLAGLMKRSLYKRALYVGKDQVGASFLTSEPLLQRMRALAREIAEAAGREEWEVIVDIAPFPADMSMGVQVRNRSVTLDLSIVSPLVNTLNEARRSQWRLGVYAPREHTGAVERAAIEVLHVKKATRQDTLA
ncbi:MAG: HD domain-containing protein [Methanomicrobiales archaeon]|jgi:HD superfamily phosphohydrolase